MNLVMVVFSIAGTGQFQGARAEETTAKRGPIQELQEDEVKNFIFPQSYSMADEDYMLGGVWGGNSNYAGSTGRYGGKSGKRGGSGGCTIEDMAGTFAARIDPYTLLVDDNDYPKAFIRQNLQTPAILTFALPQNIDTGDPTFTLVHPPLKGRGVMEVDFCRTYCYNYKDDEEDCEFVYGQLTAVTTGFVKNGILPFVMRDASCWDNGRDLPIDDVPGDCDDEGEFRPPLLIPNSVMPPRDRRKLQRDSIQPRGHTSDGHDPMIFYGEFNCNDGTIAVGALTRDNQGAGFSTTEPAERYDPNDLPIVFPGCINPKAEWNLPGSGGGKSGKGGKGRKGY